MQIWDLEKEHPNLKTSGYEITSESTDLYNCITWAAGDDSIWWSHAVGDYWPASVPRSPEAWALVLVFESLGYAVCDSDALEPGYEKVAVYVQNGEWRHAARQLSDGRWTSKIGQFEDIIHPAPENLVDDSYGSIHCIMRRQSAAFPFAMPPD